MRLRRAYYLQLWANGRTGSNPAAPCRRLALLARPCARAVAATAAAAVARLVAVGGKPEADIAQVLFLGRREEEEQRRSSSTLSGESESSSRSVYSGHSEKGLCRGALGSSREVSVSHSPSWSNRFKRNRVSSAREPPFRAACFHALEIGSR